jgi:cobalt/nickel transport system permease protein
MCALLIPSPLAGMSVVATSLGVAALTGVPLRDFVRFLAAASGFALVSLLPLSVQVRFDPLGWGWDLAGLRLGLEAGARALGTLSATLLLVFTIPFPRLLALLHQMRVPEVLTDLLGLVHRQIFLLDERYSRLHRALAARNGWHGGRNALRSLALGAAGLLVQAVVRSERLERGMASRGCPTGGCRVPVDPLEVRLGALVAAIGIPGVLAFLISWTRGRLGL